MLRKAGQPTNRLRELFAGIIEINSDDDRKISELQIDSRFISRGALFLAFPGDHTDGRHYIFQAIKNGASAVAYEKNQTVSRLETKRLPVPLIAVDNLRSKISLLASRYYGDPSHNLQLIGVTGTNGKTTVVYFLAQAFELLGNKCGIMGTLGIGHINSLKKSNLTTENAIEIQREIANFLHEGTETVCMEVSSHGLVQYRLSQLNFNVAIFTNLSRDHLDYHQTIERYAMVKKNFFQFPGLDLVVSNQDDQTGREIIKSHRGRTKISYGLKQGDICLHSLSVDERGISFSIKWREEIAIFHSLVIDQMNLANLLAVIACLIGIGVEIHEIKKVVPKLSTPPGRMELFSGSKYAPKVIVDYSHNPDSLKNTLISIWKLKPKKVVLVFGCGGDRDSGKRPTMGKIAEYYADTVILTDDNPRSESPDEIILQIKSGMNSPVQVIHDRRSAIQKAIRLSSNKDIVLIAGKGHEDTQTIKTVKFELSDREIVMQLLKVSS